MVSRAAMVDKAGKVWSLPRFWVSIHSYKKQPVKKIWVRILDLGLLKFDVSALVRPWESIFTCSKNIPENSVKDA